MEQHIVSNIEIDTSFDDTIARLFFKILELREEIAGLDERLRLIEMKDRNDKDDNNNVAVDPREGDEGQAQGQDREVAAVVAVALLLEKIGTTKRKMKKSASFP